MKAFLAEYTVAHKPELAAEGEAMLSVLQKSFEWCGYQVVSPEGTDFEAEIRNLAPGCDIGLVIAPDNLLSRYTAILEQRTHNIGCGSMVVAVCANKRRTGEMLLKHGIDTPKEVTAGQKVIKPVSGCGALNIRLSEEEPQEGEIGQEYIRGEHVSVSIVGSRIVGNACQYYSGKPPLPLAINRQHIEIGEDGIFHYMGGETPIDHPRKEELIAVAAKAMTVLGCQGYTGVDLVVADRIYVVDVNPRPTTSLVGIAACMQEEIADVLVRASRGEAPDEVHLTGHVLFDKDGRISAI
jgi:tyramine---L-glutamate ligase